MGRRCNILLRAIIAVILAAEASWAVPSKQWVWFADKGPAFPAGRTDDDAPVYGPYVEAVSGIARAHHVTRWFNGVSVTVDEEQVARLRRLPFVVAVTPVGTWRRGVEPSDTSGAYHERPARAETSPDYGPSFTQMHMVRADSLQLLGLTGQGIRIAVFDDGFNYFDHPAFSRLQILAAHDFIDGDANVSYGTTTHHGTQVLSCLAGFAPGNLIGPAYDAEFLLARTENSAYERPIEEDNWVAAAEWADSVGADVISSSIGYNYFELAAGVLDTDSSYALSNLDGKTSLITRAAQKAAGRRIVVVNAAGNENVVNGPSNWYWHGKVLMPADGDSVVAVGAADSIGRVVSFSSRGPTADGRIKPDVAALGYPVQAVANSSQYARLQGTSFATPVVAGVVAQLLQVHPTWDPIAVRTALRLSGSQALNPDTALGWGVVDGMRALAADSAVFGRIVVAETGQPIVGAFVRIYDENDMLVTYAAASAGGWFRMERLQPGTYRIRGYWPGEEVVGVETTLILPMLPREVHLELRTTGAVAGAPPPAFWWVSEAMPNPANPTTAIGFRLAQTAPGEVVRMAIYSLVGQRARELSVAADRTGRFVWDGRDERGREVASGVYLARISFGGASVVRRVVVLR